MSGVEHLADAHRVPGRLALSITGINADQRRHYRRLHAMFGRHLAHMLFAVDHFSELRWAAAVLNAEQETAINPLIDLELRRAGA